MEWITCVVNVVVNVAVSVPPGPDISVAVPITVVPSRKLTVPVGAKKPGVTAVTVAVNTTKLPAAEGFGELVKLVFVSALLTVCVIVVGLSGGANMVSPLYVAVIMCGPAGRFDTVIVAIRPLSVPVPKIVLPSRNVTVPLGVPVPETGATVAWNVIVWFTVEGFGIPTSVTVVPTRFTTWFCGGEDVLLAKFTSPL